MQIKLTGHHLDITPAIRNHVHEKMQRIQRHFDNVIDTEVILSVEKNRHKAEATIHLGDGGGRIFADTTEEDLYAAIDVLLDKLDRQILKQKEKAVDQRRQGASLKAGL
ncbi:MAG: ribosome hibernation-promoting factor, HPF/YfiA family [Halorhodospira sp.]